MKDSCYLDYSGHIRPIEEIRNKIIERINNDTEGKIHQILVELGWTPPADEKLTHACQIASANWTLSGEQVLRLYNQVTNLRNHYV